MLLTIVAKIDVEKVWTIMRKSSQNDAKTEAKIHEEKEKLVRKFDGKSIENMMVSDGAEPRFALYSWLPNPR